MAGGNQLITADELLRLPDNGFRQELVRGVLLRRPPAGAEHGRLIMNIATPLDQYVRANNLDTVCAAGTRFHLATDPDTVRAADVAFVRRERLQGQPLNDGYWRGGPDLAVEVISPDDSAVDIREKVRDFLAAGTPLVWTVFPRTREVLVHTAEGLARTYSGQDSLAFPETLAGYTCNVAGLFD